MSTHKAIAATTIGQVKETQLSTPQPGEEEVLVQVEYSSVIAFDTYTVDRGYNVPSFPITLGFNAAGIIIKIGSNVGDLHLGDRVATFARPTDTQGKAMQEFALLSKYSVAKVPDNISLAESATVPDNLITAYFALFDSLRLPIPSSLPVKSMPKDDDIVFLIYGAGATVGHYLIQLLRLAGYRRIIATASPKHHEHLRSLGASNLFDYSDSELSSKILTVNNGEPIRYSVDCIAAETTLRQVAKVVGKGSIVSLMLPIKEGSTVTTEGQMWLNLPTERDPFTAGVEVVGTKTFTYQSNIFMKENLMPRIIPQLLKDGFIQPSRLRLLEQGTLLQRAEEALDLLRNNKVSGEKVVIKI